MKILTFDEFAALPPGTLFSYYEPTICIGLYRKGETLLNSSSPGDNINLPFDYFETSLVPICWNGQEPPTLEGVETRWGEYEDGQLYAVFEPADIETLRSLLPPP
jgi:hypothetical protein